MNSKLPAFLQSQIEQSAYLISNTHKILSYYDEYRLDIKGKDERVTDEEIMDYFIRKTIWNLPFKSNDFHYHTVKTILMMNTLETFNYNCENERKNCHTCQKYKNEKGIHPHHFPSENCESGQYRHCTCDICF